MLYYIFLPDLFLSVSYFQQPTSTFQADMQHIYLDSADLDKMTIFYFSAENILCVIMTLYESQLQTVRNSHLLSAL